jgi:hypothetical protein
VYREALGYLTVDLSEEFQELAVAVPRQALADDHAPQHVQGGEQCGGAVALVVVRIVPARPFFIGSDG